MARLARVVVPGYPHHITQPRRPLPAPTATAAVWTAAGRSGMINTMNRARGTSTIHRLRHRPIAARRADGHTAPAVGRHAAGNLTFDGTQHYTYDAWGRLAGVFADDTSTGEHRAGNVVARYSYDGRGYRVSKAVGQYTGTTITGYDRTDYYYNEGWQVLEERFSDGQPLSTTVATTPHVQWLWDQRYIDSPALRWRDMNADGDFADAGDEAMHYTTDANANVTALVASSGEAAERYVYAAYGQTTVYDGDWSATRSESSYASEVLFAGYYSDPESGLRYARNRHYHDTLGRWLQRDPAEADENLTRYVHNNPTNRVDPSGLAESDEWGGIRDGDPLWSRVEYLATVTKPILPGQVGKDADAAGVAGVSTTRPDGATTRPEHPTTAPAATIRPAAGGTKTPAIGPGEFVVKTTSMEAMLWPYTCWVGGLGNWASMIKEIGGEKGLNAFAKALGLTPQDLDRYGYAGNVTPVKRQIGRKVADPKAPPGSKRLQTRQELYVEVSEFVAVPLREELQQWEKDVISTKNPRYLNRFPTGEANRPKKPTPSPGLEEWAAVRALNSRHNGDTMKFTRDELDQLMKLAIQRGENALVIVLDPGEWKDGAFVSD